MPDRIPQSATLRVPLKAYLASDHVSDATGKTLAVTISKNGAAFANPSAGATNATEIGNGWYYVDLSTTDTGTQGPVVIRAAVATVDNVEREYSVVDSNSLGAAYLDAAMTTRTKPADTQAAVTLVATATNLTNAPTSGDLTAAMKSSVTTAATAATPIAASVTGAVGSVTAGVTVTTNSDKTGYSLTVAPPTAVAVRTEMDSNSTKLANLDATISSRSSHSAADVWASATRTLSTYGTLVADVATAIWGAAARTLTAFGFTVTATPDSNVALIKAQTDLIPASPAAIGSAMTLTSAYDAAKTAAQGTVPTTEQITDAALRRHVVWNSGTSQFDVYNEAGTVISFHLTPTLNAAAQPIVGMVSS